MIFKYSNIGFSSLLGVPLIERINRFIHYNAIVLMATTRYNMPNTAKMSNKIVGIVCFIYVDILIDRGSTSTDFVGQPQMAIV
jgi:hypothetical protein